MNMPNIGDENIPRFTSVTIRTETVGTTAAALTASPGGLAYLRARPSNTDDISIGSSNAVTDGAGWTLEPGDISPPIVVNSLAQIYAISGTVDQKLEVIIQS